MPEKYTGPCFKIGDGGAECGRANVPLTTDRLAVRCKGCQVLNPMTDVIFRIDRRGDFKGEPFAVFPGLAGTIEPGTCTYYARVGQHSHAPVNNLTDTRISRLATEAEYADLFKELTRAGYLLRIVQKATRKHYAQRVEQTDRHTAAAG